MPGVGLPRASGPGFRIAAEKDRLQQEIALLREELGIQGARMSVVVPHRRPRYAPTERLAILEVRAARGWSLQPTADHFLLAPATVALWAQRVDEQGPPALLQLRQPVNRFPDFVRYAVQRLKTLCPSRGKVKIAQILARAGLHLSPTTVGRRLREPTHLVTKQPEGSTARVGTAKCPNQVVAPRPDDRTDGLGLWDALGSVRAATGRAVWLVGRRGQRPVLAPFDVPGRVSPKTRLANRRYVSGKRHSKRRCEAEVSGLRQGQSLLLGASGDGRNGQRTSTLLLAAPGWVLRPAERAL